MEYQHMSALDASQDREGHEIDSGGRSESDDEFDQDSVAIGNLAAAARPKLTDQLLASFRADAAVEAAFRGVPRHTFLPEMDPVEAYQDQTQAADAQSQPDCDSPQPALAPATTPETMAPLTRRLQRVTGLLMRLSRTRASSYDPLFLRPDLIEDDYYRLRNQPGG
jgi:hypothetical protein